MTRPDPPDAERLREAFARLEDEPGWPDADAERIFSALHGDMSAEERRRVVDELVRNPRAVAAWRLARELEPEGAPRSVTTRPALKWLSAAALLVLVAGGIWQWQLWRDEAPVPEYRSSDPRSISSLVPEGWPLSRAEPVLRWTAIQSARYRIRVLTTNLTPLVEAEELTTPEYRVPDAVIETIPRGGAIVWQVEARVTGQPTVTSPSYVVQLME